MVDFLKDIYFFADIRYELKKLIRYIHSNRINDIRLWLLDELSDRLLLAIQKLSELNPQEAIAFEKKLRLILELVGNNNVLAADMLYFDLVATIENAIKQLGNINVTDEDNRWRFISTESGYLTLKNLIDDKIIHSMIEPREEAYDLAECIYSPEQDTYIFLRCGLGYLPYEVYLKSEESAEIVIFENDDLLIQYAYLYGVLDRIPENKLRIYSYDTIDDFMGFINEERGRVHLFENLTCNIKELDELRMRLNTSLSSNEILRINFYKNQRNVLNSIEYIKDVAIGEKVLVVAAGPSLDSQMDYIKGLQEKNIIVAVGTIYKKLLKYGIEPDYVVIADPRKRTLQQIVDIENGQATMIIAAVAYWEIAESYKGEKYLMYPAGCLEEIDRTAEREGIPLFITGGSVVSFAIETAVFLGAQIVELIGVDLAYANGLTHTSDTVHKDEAEKKAMIEVESVSGGTVYTTPALKSYIKDVERQVKFYDKVTFINRSTVGAKITGTK